MPGWVAQPLTQARQGGIHLESIETSAALGEAKPDLQAPGDTVRAAETMAGIGPSPELLLGFVPITLLLLAFFLVPLIIMVLYSLWTMEGFHVVARWTLENYVSFFTAGMYTRVLLKTFGISLLVTMLSLLSGYPFAYLLVRHVSKRWQIMLLVMVIIPFWTSYLLRVYAWMGILGRKGLINQFLTGLGLIDQPLQFLLYNNFSVTIVFLYLYLPFAIITLYASLEKFDFTQINAAMDLGATPWRAFVEIMLPQTRQGVITASIFIFIPMLGEYITPKLVGGTEGIMMSNLIVNLFRGFQFPEGSAVALSIAMLIVVMLVLFRNYIRIEELY
jgi:spermidine/putrescine transport system permease protein